MFENYIETGFDGPTPAEFKLRHFEYNYRSYFPASGGKVLDIGIGRGEMLQCMKNWGMDYEGVDISPSTVRFCQSLGLNCGQTEDTAAWLSERVEEYDLITALDVLEHIPGEKLVELLNAINRSLKADGKAIFQVPNLQSPFGWLHHFNDITHVHGFVEHSLSQVLRTAGFTNFSFHGFEEITGRRPKNYLQKMLRWSYWQVVRGLRTINGNPNPHILHPVFFCIANKSNSEHSETAQGVPRQ